MAGFGMRPEIGDDGDDILGLFWARLGAVFWSRFGAVWGWFRGSDMAASSSCLGLFFWVLLGS